MTNVYVMNDNNNGILGVFTSHKQAFKAFMRIADDLGQKDMKVYWEGETVDFKPIFFRGHMIQIDFLDRDGDPCYFTIERMKVNHY